MRRAGTGGRGTTGGPAIAHQSRRGHACQGRGRCTGQRCVRTSTSPTDTGEHARFTRSKPIHGTHAGSRLGCCSRFWARFLDTGPPSGLKAMRACGVIGFELLGKFGLECGVYRFRARSFRESCRRSTAKLWCLHIYNMMYTYFKLDIYLNNQVDYY